jgi:RNA polymerase sigma factor (sigma-70 family)
LPSNLLMLIPLAMPQAGDEWVKTRITLINRLRNWRDQASWQDFFDTYCKLIHNSATKSGLTPTEAQDVVQETLVTVAKHIPTFKYDPSIGSFKSWLYNITRWRIADQFRKRDQFDTVADETGTGTRKVEKVANPASHDLEMIWDAEWEKGLLDSAVTKVRRQLDPQKFQIFDFYVNKDWPPEKVAQAFGISTSQVYLGKHRVTEMIKQEIGRLQKEIT